MPFLDDRWDVLLLNDCAYDAGACVHLARTVAALCYANPRMQILVANEPRTALEGFLEGAGPLDWCQLLAPCLDVVGALARGLCLPGSRVRPWRCTRADPAIDVTLDGAAVDATLRRPARCVLGCTG